MDNRASKLNKLFSAILYRQQTVTIQNAPLFLEAICAQSDPADCISRLIASKAGLVSVQAAMRSNLSSAFLNGAVTALLKYIQATELASIGQGDFLGQLVLKIAEPPIFWSPFAQASLVPKSCRRTRSSALPGSCYNSYHCPEKRQINIASSLVTLHC